MICDLFLAQKIEKNDNSSKRNREKKNKKKKGSKMVCGGGGKSINREENTKQKQRAENFLKIRAKVNKRVFLESHFFHST